MASEPFFNSNPNAGDPTLPDNTGRLENSINTVIPTAGITNHLIYNNTNKTIDFRVDTSSAISLVYRPSFHHPDGIEHEEGGDRHMVTMEAGETIFVTATTSAVTQNFNIDADFAWVRHRNGPTYRHYFRKENGLADRGALIVSPDIT